MKLWAAIAALLLAVIAGCGGGGSLSTPGKIVPLPETLRTDLQFGYWAGNPLYMLEQANHVNCWFARDDTAPVWHAAMAAQLQLARDNGITCIVIQVRDFDPVEQRSQLGRLSERGYFKGWTSIGFLDLDEPETEAGGRFSDQAVVDRVTRLRQVMFDVPGLLGAKIGIFFQCESGKRPGIKAFDRVGCYRYEAGACAKLEEDYARLRAEKAIGALLWVIPAGAHINGKEGRQDPACWHSYAQRFLDVWGVVVFMFQSGADPRNHIVGVRDQPDMLKLYCETGRVIKNPKEEPRC